MVELIAWTLAVLVALAVLHHLASWAESRGWIYYRKRRASPGTAAGAFLEMQSLLEPGKKHVVESKRASREEADDSGEPPEPARTEEPS